MSAVNKRLVVAGGGAAGFFCAVNAARLCPELEVILLEKTTKLLSKVKVSGGGRCNVTHHAPDIAYMSKRYPRGQHFVKKSFSRFFVPDTIEWFAERGVKLKAEPDGRMFPVTDNSQTIIDCLLREADKYRVAVETGKEVKTFKKSGNGRWQLELQDGKTLQADYLCIAAGGFAQPDKFAWLAQSGHQIIPPAPSLFTFNMPGNPITSLMGVATEAHVKIAGTKLQEQGPLLITHWGMSGPAVLRLSAWGARELQQLQYTFTAIVNWLPGYNENTLRDEWQQLRFDLGKQKLHNKNPFNLVQRLWQFLLQQAGVPEEMRWADLPAKDQNRLLKLLVSMEFPVKGKTTFKEEFVTCGGVALSEIAPETMESRLVPDLYFAGEVMDVDGITGGFNFQHAWTSGFVAAQSIAAKV
ncbi:NAD(P)/FAD-dependent oxidoreductase [Chitinophaga nivalis]|uniref:NAD(P)/FAD-dependent oxidoreductase n=1 Tax=Chitinophaga nivalis TaxID=2991709 RepID=A0ABT3IR32_9BACT|nr:NAD(P)/FAD-dependent oxidoreductase [Chitinophaga nivalis]MCW3464090.1 NAD(P)/FAD-dependent oxidoreductase [Chitinophaga nivalis]MCW3486220.1 NAD(P)/FAD-dependent oxidoreductase [Chitinophaga nivalis]